MLTNISFLYPVESPENKLKSLNLFVLTALPPRLTNKQNQIP